MTHIPDTDEVVLPHGHRRADDPAATLPEQAQQAGLTEDQLAFFTEQTRRAVSKALWRYAKPVILTYCALIVGLVLAFHANAVTARHQREQSSAQRTALVDSGRAVAVDGCNRDFRDKDDFRGVLIRLRAATTLSRTQTPEQKAAALSFYDKTLSKQAYPNCGAARSIITSDPNAPIVVPRPLTVKHDAQNANVAQAEARIIAGGG